MKNVVIFSGGTGSIALQNSINEYYGNNINVDIIISAYDNGKSTGECRKAFNNDILGPSDLRKNQMTQYKIQKKLDNKNSLILKYFEYRFDAIDYKNAYEIVISETNKLSSVLTEYEKSFLLKLINNFFFTNMSAKFYREDIKNLNYNDFSISNILYSSAANINNNSLAAAGKVMADFLGIKNNVHLISDINLYLYAITKNGYLITDEADIVDWARFDDEIDHVKLLTKYGQEYIPVVDEGLINNECENLIMNADIIIFSSGTQWSSLIPTYMHSNFSDMIKNSKAEKYIVMNNIPDKDMYGIDALKLLKIVNRYVDLSDFTGVFNECAEDSMKLNDNIINSKILKDFLSANMSEICSKKHDNSIFKYIMYHYYRDYINKKYIIFDFDDTLWARDTNLNNISIENINLLNETPIDMSIVSGNSINKFKDAIYTCKSQKTAVNKCFNGILCNGGNSMYELEDWDLHYVTNLEPEFNIINMLDLIRFVINTSKYMPETNITISKFENRGNCILSIKPIENNKIRNKFTDILNDEFNKSDIFNNYIAYANGRTTIDIMRKEYTKGKIVNLIIDEYDLDDCLYIGDEIFNGNDKSIVNECNIDYINVNDVYDTNVFLRTLKLYN